MVSRHSDSLSQSLTESELMTYYAVLWTCVALSLAGTMTLVVVHVFRFFPDSALVRWISRLRCLRCCSECSSEQEREQEQERRGKEKQSRSKELVHVHDSVDSMENGEEDQVEDRPDGRGRMYVRMGGRRAEDGKETFRTYWSNSRRPRSESALLGSLIVVCMSLCDFGVSLTFFFFPNGPPSTSDSICIAQAFLQDVLEISSVCYTLSYSVYVNRLVRLRGRGDWEYRWMYLGAPLLYPIVVGIVNVAGDFYGPAGFWCWIREEFVLWRFFEFFVFSFLVLIVNAVLYAHAFCTTRQHEITMSQYAALPELRLGWRLMLYFVVFFVSYSFAAMNRIQNAIQPDSPSFTFSTLETVFFVLWGFFNSIVYNLNMWTAERKQREAEKSLRLTEISLDTYLLKRNDNS